MRKFKKGDIIFSVEKNPYSFQIAKIIRVLRGQGYQSYVIELLHDSVGKYDGRDDWDVQLTDNCSFKMEECDLEMFRVLYE